MSMTKEEIIKQYEMAIEGGELIAPFMGEDVKEVYEMLKAGLSALRPITREQVEQVWRGEWKHYLPPLGAGDVQCRCTRCGRAPDVETPFCAWCGAPMTDKAVDMVMERLEALYEET